MFFVCFLVALIFFILAALGVDYRRYSFLACGAAAFTVPFLVQNWPG